MSDSTGIETAILLLTVIAVLGFAWSALAVAWDWRRKRRLLRAQAETRAAMESIEAHLSQGHPFGLMQFRIVDGEVGMEWFSGDQVVGIQQSWRDALLTAEQLRLACIASATLNGVTEEEMFTAAQEVAAQVSNDVTTWIQASQGS